MSHTNETTNLKLPQFIGSDIPSWLTDINQAFLSIDTGVGNIKTTVADADGKAESASEVANSALTSANNAISQSNNNKTWIDYTASITNANAALIESLKNTGCYYNAALELLHIRFTATLKQNASWNVQEGYVICNLPFQVNPGRTILMGGWIRADHKSLSARLNLPVYFYISNDGLSINDNILSSLNNASTAEICFSAILNTKGWNITFK